MKGKIKKQSHVYRELMRYKDVPFSLRWYDDDEESLNANAFGRKIHVSAGWEKFLQKDEEPDNPYSKRKVAFAHTLFHELTHRAHEPLMMPLPGSYARFRNFTRECRADHYGLLKCIQVFPQLSREFILEAIDLKIEQDIRHENKIDEKSSLFDKKMNRILQSHPEWSFRARLMRMNVPFEDKLEEIALHAGYDHQSANRTACFTKMKQYLIEEQSKNPFVKGLVVINCIS